MDKEFLRKGEKEYWKITSVNNAFKITVLVLFESQIVNADNGVNVHCFKFQGKCISFFSMS